MVNSTSMLHESVADASVSSAAPASRRPPVRRERARRGYAGRTAQQLSEERRERLLNSALELFTERGYHRTPIELLCSHSRVTTRHFYEQFDGREAVLRALYQNIVDSAKLAVFTSLRDTRLSVSERLQLAVATFVGHYTDDPRRARIACVEIMGVSPELSKLRRGNLRDFAALLENFTGALVDQGLLPKRDYHASCIGMVGAIIELMADWVIAEQRPPAESVTRSIVRLLRALIAGARSIDDELAHIET